MSTPAPEPTHQLAANLRRLMRQRCLGPTEVAARAEVHLTHVTAILRAEHAVRLDTLVRLAGAVGVEPGELLAGVRWVVDEGGAGNFVAGD